MVGNFSLAIYSFVTAPTDADTAYVRKARVALELGDDVPLFNFATYD